MNLIRTFRHFTASIFCTTQMSPHEDAGCKKIGQYQGTTLHVLIIWLKMRKFWLNPTLPHLVNNRHFDKNTIYLEFFTTIIGNLHEGPWIWFDLLNVLRPLFCALTGSMRMMMRMRLAWKKSQKTLDTSKRLYRNKPEAPGVWTSVANTLIYIYICQKLFFAFRSLRTCTKWHLTLGVTMGIRADQAMTTWFGWLLWLVTRGSVGVMSRVLVVDGELS